MGPEKNAQLYAEVGESRLPALNDELYRRTSLAKTLEELSESFAASEVQPFTEPTMFARLYGLTQVQRMHLGVAGFHPLAAVDFNSPLFEITGSALAHHDEFEENGARIRSRIVKLNTPLEFHEKVEIFGLNIYQPDIDLSDLDLGETTPHLIAIGDRGRIVNDKKPINGETPLLAARSLLTSDSKIYSVSFVDPSERASYGSFEQIEHLHEKKVRLRLPDFRIVEVEQLSGESLRQAVEEFRIAYEKSREQSGSMLTPEEDRAVRESLGYSARDEILEP